MLFGTIMLIRRMPTRQSDGETVASRHNEKKSHDWTCEGKEIVRSKDQLC